jgi:uncharacterized membrane protein
MTKTLNYIYSYRDVNPSDYAIIYQACKKKKEYSLERNECMRNIQDIYNSVESGRYAEMAEAVSKFVGHLDRDEQDLFFKRNPEMLDIINEYNYMKDYVVYDKPESAVAKALKANRGK